MRLHRGRCKGQENLEDFDVVIATYQRLAAEFKAQGAVGTGGEKSLFSYRWNRIVLDEAHMVRGRGTLASRAAIELEG